MPWDAARDLLAFIGASPSPYHAVAEAARRLKAAGYGELDERDVWTVEPGRRAFVVRGGTLIAFCAGSAPPSEAGFLLIGAHTDSPNLRVKPQPELTSVGHRQLAVEVYGGVLLHTWLDRDLGIFGRVALRSGKTVLITLGRGVARIPSLAIHLNREVSTQGLQLNAQTQLVPTLGVELSTTDVLPSFKAFVAEELARSGESVAADDIFGWDLCLADAQDGALGGVEQDLLFAARLDNLASCHAGLQALVGAGDAGRATRVLVLYDHEEVGSQSATGARSIGLHGLLERIATAYSGAGDQAMPRALARSLLVSADMAHAVHPNYVDKHDKQHQPRIGAGPVIKVNAGQAYATDAVGAALFEEACREVDVVPQRFVSRNDLPCGSTIGPISAAKLGVRTVDVGNPMLSMHSCRETAGTRDVEPMIRALTALLRRPLDLSPR